MTRRRALALAAIAVIAAGCSSASSDAPVTAPASSAASTTAARSASTSLSADQNAPGDIPDNQQFVVFSPPQGGFVVKVPEGWSRADGPTGTLFSDKYNSVRIESAPAANAPTPASAADLADIAAAGGNAAIRAVSSVSRRGGPAILISYEADSPVNEVTGKSARIAVERYEFWRAGTEVILTLSAAIGADNVDPWRTVTDSLTWTS